jgi:hypothetical protein
MITSNNSITDSPWPHLHLCFAATLPTTWTLASSMHLWRGERCTSFVGRSSSGPDGYKKSLKSSSKTRNLFSTFLPLLIYLRCPLLDAPAPTAPSHSRPSSSQDCKSTLTIRWPTTSGSPTTSSARNARPSYIPDQNIVIVLEKETSEISGAAHLLRILGACLCLLSVFGRVVIEIICAGYSGAPDDDDAVHPRRRVDRHRAGTM